MDMQIEHIKDENQVMQKEFYTFENAKTHILGTL